ncbi:hypothetical protein BLNAU_14585 [Blattamonas nauphoetae]|uniref:Uncharacterized protein n=1 Tax=Blattamonas nauphoetae TaxID=2049346 RepID=A0ABQ9XD93_9EUKA|nr:hypothetical protein BLNAU_14585 [Blattamonas nauphoetae]
MVRETQNNRPTDAWPQRAEHCVLLMALAEKGVAEGWAVQCVEGSDEIRQGTANLNESQGPKTMKDCES